MGRATVEVAVFPLDLDHVPVPCLRHMNAYQGIGCAVLSYQYLRNKAVIEPEFDAFDIMIGGPNPGFHRVFDPAYHLESIVAPDQFEMGVVAHYPPYPPTVVLTNREALKTWFSL